MAYKKKPINERKTQSYSVALKRQAVEEYLLGAATKASILKKYKLKGSSSLQKWMVALGYTRGRSSQIPTFEVIKRLGLTHKARFSSDERIQLQQEINALKRQLEEEQLRTLLYRKIIEKAEQEYNICIKKKLNTK